LVFDCLAVDIAEDELEEFPDAVEITAMDTSYPQLMLWFVQGALLGRSFGFGHW
jgi:hypothetical protein